MRIASLEPYKFSFPRNGWEAILANGEDLWYLENRCKIKELDNVVSLRAPNLGLSDISHPPSDFQTQYDQDKAMIEEGRRDGRSKILPNGIERIIKGHWLVFILPKKDAPTENGEPIVLNCVMATLDPNDIGLINNCSTSYVYKKDLLLWYRFFRAYYPDVGHLSADRHMRYLIEKSLINKGHK